MAKKSNDFDRLLTKRRNLPGPGAYEPYLKVGKNSGLSTVKNDSTYSFAKSDNRPKTRITGCPSPDRYDPKSIYGFYRDKKTTKFGTSKRILDKAFKI